MTKKDNMLYSLTLEVLFEVEDGGGTESFTFVGDSKEDVKTATQLKLNELGELKAIDIKTSWDDE